MANLTAVILLLVAAAAVASAFVYTTEVTTTFIEEGNPQESCEMEMQKKMPMTMCLNWMRSQMGRRAVANPRYGEDAQLQKCCREIKRFSTNCRCDAVKVMMGEMPRYGRMEEMRSMACSLPAMCGVTRLQLRQPLPRLNTNL